MLSWAVSGYGHPQCQRVHIRSMWFTLYGIYLIYIYVYIYGVFTQRVHIPQNFSGSKHHTRHSFWNQSPQNGQYADLLRVSNFFIWVPGVCFGLCDLKAREEGEKVRELTGTEVGHMHRALRVRKYTKLGFVQGLRLLRPIIIVWVIYVFGHLQPSGTQHSLVSYKA